jgi:hypothetical protein
VEIQFVERTLDEAVIAGCIYRDFPHQTTSQGVALSQKVRPELETFLSEYNSFIGAVFPYYRIDAFFDQDTLWILEVNAAFVDGWGTALNLTRASGGKVNCERLTFPQHLATVEEDYLPELRLLVAELAAQGLIDHQIIDYVRTDDEPVYLYGRVDTYGSQQVFPLDGLRLDNKVNLALFSREWRGNSVQVPQHYLQRFQTWQEIPTQVVLKFCDKNSRECQQARTSVFINKPEGKAKFLKQCYESEVLLAQQYIPPAVHPLGNAQLILLTAGNAPVTGYVQYSQKPIINDNSIHGPLWIE